MTGRYCKHYVVWRIGWYLEGGREFSFGGDGSGKGATAFEGYYVVRQTFSTVSV
jgi:hypothetical protein